MTLYCLVFNVYVRPHLPFQSTNPLQVQILLLSLKQNYKVLWIQSHSYLMMMMMILLLLLLMEMKERGKKRKGKRKKMTSTIQAKELMENPFLNKDRSYREVKPSLGKWCPYPFYAISFEFKIVLLFFWPEIHPVVW